MPLYEFLCLAKPALARPSLSRMMQRVGELVLNDGGIVTDVTSFGEQHLAYDIRKPMLKADKVRAAGLADVVGCCLPMQRLIFMSSCDVRRRMSGR